MWQMTLKQRRRHGELMSTLDRLKRDPYAKIPEGYVEGESPEEDEKYKQAFEELKSIIEEIYELEVTAREGN